MLNNDIENVLLNRDEIKAIILTLSQQITEDYHDKFPLIVGLLKGCVPFMSDLLKTLDFHVEVAYMNISSYHGGVESTGDVKIDMDLGTSVKNRDVLLTEDIVDTGRTISAVVDLLKYRGAKSVKVVTLMDKPAGRVQTFTPEYVGKVIPKVFVVGYGLDYEEKYRNLPYVGVLKPSVYN